MIPLARLQSNLQFNKDLGELIEVMKLAATMQFNQFRGRKAPPVQFLSSLEQAFRIISGQKTMHWLLQPTGDLPKAIILLSSDEGFLGELNSLLVNKLMGVRQTQDKIIVVGRQGAEYLEQLNIHFSSYPSSTEKAEFKQIEELRNDVFRRYLKKEIGGIHIVFPHFISITVQQIESETLLPLSEFSSGPVDSRSFKEFLIEPDLDLIIRGWIKLWLGFRMYQIFWTAKLAEYAARIMHLESSIQELNRTNQQLKLEYFKHMHNLSDKNIREISASRMLGRH